MHQQFIRRSWTAAALTGATALVLGLPSARAIESQTVAINFAGQVGEAPFACGETYPVGTTATAVTPQDFRFYISQVALVDGDGNEVPLVLRQDGKWQHQDVALIDFEDKSGACANGTTETNSQVIGAVPAGDYTGLKFTLGVPFGLNHIDSTLAPSPLNLTSMWWNWNAGYKFARADLMPVMAMSPLKQHGDGNHGGGHSGMGNKAQPFNIHLGSVGCQRDASEAPVACQIPNRVEVVMAEFDPATDIVVADLAALLSDTDLTAQNQEGTPVGCMSSPRDRDCAGILGNLGLPFNEQPVAEQTFFTKMSK